VKSATLSLYVTDVDDSHNDSESYTNIITTNPASNTALSTADVDQVKGTDGNFPLGSGIAMQEQSDDDKDNTNITTSQYANWALNATGLANVSKTGVSKFGAAGGHDIENVSPPAGNNTQSIVRFRSADYTGTTNDPKLTVEHGSAPPSSTGGRVLQDITYTYDNVGNITAITDISDSGAAKTVTFGYDDLYRLTFATTTVASSTPFLQTYSYSSIGNISEWRTSPSATSTYTYASTGWANPHAATDVGGTALAYDKNGNLTSYGSTYYGWDYRNHLTQVGSGIATTSTYSYDFQRNRVIQTVNGTSTLYANRYYSTSGATTTKYIYAGDTLIAMVEKVGGATTTHIVHSDHLGGTNVVTDADGDLVQTLDYYPFGSLRINQKSTAFDDARKFTGHEYDAASGLTYMGFQEQSLENLW
jgi:hypothetical protein